MWGWLSIVADWLLLTLLGYVLLRLVAGTRAFGLVFGIIAIFAIYAMTGDAAFGLRGVHELIGWFSGSVPVLLIILFQREIRFGLTRFNITDWIQGRANESLVNLTEELVKALTTMSESRTGALIAVERSAEVDRELFNVGFLVDASVHWEMLVAIFQPTRHNLLHDGGVVIREGRIAMAGVFFPLTQNANIEAGLGTRHRAAIGLSETLNALVLVVSEENGVISIAENGRLTRYTDPNLLRADLAKRLGATSRAIPRATGAVAAVSVSGAGGGKSL
jgi:uncharacterized protein (TIGR00159 family)